MINENEKTLNENKETINVPTKYCILMSNIIDVVAKRGAINSNEFKIVGELTEFLKKELAVEEKN